MIAYHDTDGLTLSVNLYEGDALVDTVSMTESPASSGRYIVTDAAISALGTMVAGVYDYRVYAGSTIYTQGRLIWDGEQEVTLPIDLTERIDALTAAVQGLFRARVEV